MIPYARQSIDDADITAVIDVLRSDFLTQGPVAPRFEQTVADYCGAKHAVAVSNATSALHIAVRALGLKKGGLLWTSPISFVASANCGLYCEAEVDFVDIDPQTFNLSPGALREKLQRARDRGRIPDVLVAVDFSGQPCELDAIAALRDEYGFKIVEDASHAIGATYRGGRTGNCTYADVTVFSFHPVKIITTAEGGMALTNDSAVAGRMRLLRGHGITRDRSMMEQADRAPWEYEQIDLGFNYRLTEVQAALGIAQMGRIDAFIARRRAIAERYDKELAELPVVIPHQHPQTRSAYHLYVVQVADGAKRTRREVYDALVSRGIAPNVHYMPIYTQPYYQALGFDAGYCPNAEAYYRRALSLPMYVDLDMQGQTRVIDALREALAVG